MLKRTAVIITLLFSALLLSSNPVLRAQENWTCDGGPHDVLNATQDAFDQGDNARALKLVKQAEAICADSNPVRAGQASILRAQIEAAAKPTATPRRGATPNTTNADRNRAIELNERGLALYQMGRFKEALAAFEGGLAIVQRIKERQGEGIFLNGIGMVYYGQGQYAKALDYYNQALDIALEVEDRIGEGSALNGIGMVYYMQGQYAKALDYFDQSLVASRAIGYQETEGATLNNIGLVYHTQGQYAKALDHYNQALVVQRAVGDRTGEGQTINNAGAVYKLQGQYAKALDHYNQALDIARETGNRAAEGTALNNIGQIYQAQKQYAKALNYYNQALALMRQIGDPASEGKILNNVGGIYDIQGQYAKALETLNQSLAIVRKVGDRVGEAVALANRGIIYEKLRQSANAMTDYRAAIDVAERVLSDAALDSAIASLAAQEQNSLPYQRLAALLIAEGKTADALAYMERGRAILIRRDLAGKPVDFRQGDQALLQKEAELKAARDSAQQYLDSLRKDSSASAADIRQAQTALDKARRDYQQQLETMQLRGGFVARQLSRQVASLDQIRAALPPDTTLVLFQLGDPNSLVFLVTDKTLDTVRLDVTDKQIAEQVKVFTADRKAMADTSLRKLYGQVIAPLKDKLKTKRLLIAPDGALNVVPFAALKTAEGRYLIDDYAISLIPSATALVLLKERQPAGKATSPGLVLAQPAAPNLPAIQHAKLEAESVGKLLGLTPRLDASESDLRKQATGSRVIYLAAHAELDRFAPLFGVVYLKGDQQHDGRFEVREVYELDLSQGTELVVLSGCNTASGGTGEEFGVMTRAFFGAGAPRVVGSLWSVDDVATADLLTTYMLLRDKLHSDVDALQAAMLKTRQQYPEPYYWAGFVLTGLP